MRDGSYWYARGFIAGNPPIGNLLQSYFGDEFPPAANAADGDAAADALALLFADAFVCCPHGDIELAFVQWMARAISQESSLQQHLTETAGVWGRMRACGS